MKKLLTTLSLSAVFVLPAYATETYTIDPTHTYALWHVNHMGFSNLSGKWPAQGTIDFDKIKPQNSKVNVTINMNELTTGVVKLDEHLKSADFFNTTQFPTATFVSDKITVQGKTTAKIHGNLTVHGVTKPITLDATLNKVGTNPMTQKKAIGFTAHTTLKRSDFGVDAHVPAVGDEVKVELELEAQKN